MRHRGALREDCNILRLMEAANPLVGFSVSGLHEEPLEGSTGDVYCGDRGKGILVFCGDNNAALLQYEYCRRSKIGQFW